MIEKLNGLLLKCDNPQFDPKPVEVDALVRFWQRYPEFARCFYFLRQCSLDAVPQRVSVGVRGASSRMGAIHLDEYEGVVLTPLPPEESEPLSPELFGIKDRKAAKTQSEKQAKVPRARVVSPIRLGQQAVFRIYTDSEDTWDVVFEWNGSSVDYRATERALEGAHKKVENKLRELLAAHKFDSSKLITSGVACRRACGAGRAEDFRLFPSSNTLNWPDCVRDLTAVAAQGEISQIFEVQTELARIVAAKSDTLISGSPGPPQPLVVLHGAAQKPIVCGKEVEPLGAPVYRVIEALLAAGPNGMSKSELEKVNGDALKYLRNLRKIAHWSDAIKMAGQAHGRYAVVHK